MSTPTKPPAERTCELLGPTALVVQALMGVGVILVLLYKRSIENPRRKWRIWMFDVGKQVVGQIVIHFSNVFISDLVAHHSVQNPCVLYFLNIVVDTTIGVGILYLLLWGATKLLTEYFHLPGFQSGQYGDGPKPSFSFWARQAAVYVCALLTMKLVVVILFAIWPGIFDIGEWLLSWTGSSDWAQVTVVMGLCPIVFNMLQFWLIDSIVKARDSLGAVSPSPLPTTDGTQDPLIVNGHESDSDDENTRIRRRKGTLDDLERADVSSVKLSAPSSPITGDRRTLSSSSRRPADAKPVTGKRQASTSKPRLPPPKDDHWGWEDPDWEAEASGAWGDEPDLPSHKTENRRVAVGRKPSSSKSVKAESGKAVGMEVLKSNSKD